MYTMHYFNKPKAEQLHGKSRYNTRQYHTQLPFSIKTPAEFLTALEARNPDSTECVCWPGCSHMGSNTRKKSLFFHINEQNVATSVHHKFIQ